MRRREFIALVGGTIASPLVARAQPPKVARIGALYIGLADSQSFTKELREGLRELGYIEGQNIAFEFRSAEGKLDRLPELAAELVRLKVDVIVTLYVPSSLAAKHATTEIPIVAIVGDPVETGIVSSLSQSLRDRRAVARYAGLTGAPDESGSKRQEKGLAKAGNARVRRGMIQLAWRFLLFQKDSALAQWYRARTESGGKKRKTMIVALARKLLVALWRLVTTGEVPAGVVLRAA